jgi:hypothetical protein
MTPSTKKESVMTHTQPPKTALIVLAAGLAAFIALLFFGSSSGQANGADRNDLISANAAFAYCKADLSFIDLSLSVEADPSNPDDGDIPSVCLCEGSGRSGDGLGPCECNGNCQCKRGGPLPPEHTQSKRPLIPMDDGGRVHVLMLKPPFACPWCVRWEKEVLRPLQDDGYVVGFLGVPGESYEGYPAFKTAANDTVLIGYRDADYFRNLLDDPKDYE